MELKKLRKDLKISQEELARKMKVKREYITRIESGEQNITIETLNRIAEATGRKFEFHYEFVLRDSWNINRHYEANLIPFELKFRLPPLRKGSDITERFLGEDYS